MRSLALLPMALLCASPLPAVSAASAAIEEHARARPNIVVVLADDMGIGDPGCYNEASRIATPALDRLAQEGMRLTDAHSPSAVCTPTRYGLLTGRYAWRTRMKSGVLWGYSANLIDAERTTIASLLKEAGYRTGAIGKWHLGLGASEPVDYSQPLKPSPIDLGFDSFFGIPASLDMDPYLFVRDDRAVAAPTETIEGSEHRRQNGGGFWRAGDVAPGFRHEDVLPRLADEAEAFLRAQSSRAEDAPFFLYLALSAPHTPWLPLEEFRGKSGAGYYGDFAMQVDAVVGRVLRVLDECELASETLVVYTSDNGGHWPVADIERFGHRSNGPYRGQKADIHEGGHRVPFLARWPGRIPAGTVRDDLVCLTDLFATCAALVGRELADDEGEDSFDVSHVLLDRPFQGEASARRTAIVHHSLDGMFAIREGRWKLIEGLGTGGFTNPKRIEPEPGGPTGQLYDLVDDVAETNDRFGERPDVVARLGALLERYRTTGRSR